MRTSAVVRLSIAAAASAMLATGCAVSLDSASQAQVDSLIASTEASAEKAGASAAAAEASARSATASADKAAAASQKADAILFRTMRK